MAHLDRRLSKLASEKVIRKANDALLEKGWEKVCGPPPEGDANFLAKVMTELERMKSDGHSDLLDETAIKPTAKLVSFMLDILISGWQRDRDWQGNKLKLDGVFESYYVLDDANRERYEYHHVGDNDFYSGQWYRQLKPKYIYAKAFEELGL